MPFLTTEAAIHVGRIGQDASAKLQSDTFITQLQKGRNALNFRRLLICPIRQIIMEQVREAIGTEEAEWTEKKKS